MLRLFSPPPVVLAALLVQAALAASLYSNASAQCFGFGPGLELPNVVWGLVDSVSACPAGDSVLAGRPARLRIGVHYEDNFCTARVGVPPESIWVTYSVTTGNLKVNDKGLKVFADDSTNANGDARITIPSFSGCGRLSVNLFVSGVLQGSKLAFVRTADATADGRVVADDPKFYAPCDLDFDGDVDPIDRSLTLAHAYHWHRNALHGTLVRRTNAVNLGAGFGFWSPSGKWIAYGDHPGGPCKQFIVASDPKDGDGRTQITFPTIPDSADYDPSWSPLNTEFIFGRFDNTIYRKDLPWVGSAISLVTHHDDGSFLHRGDLAGAISPDGKWVAFSRRSVPNGPYEIHKIPISGDTSKRVKLTELQVSGSDWYPRWSPDGVWIVFQREALGGYFGLYRVRSDGSSNLVAEPVFDDNSGKNPTQDAANPSYSPDGLLIVAGYGPRVVGEHVTHTIDPSLSIKRPIANYDEPQFAAKHFLDFPILSPTVSPDGTRLLLISSQLYAARRNMNLPPRFTSVTSTDAGTQAVPDTAATMHFTFDPFGASTITVEATDPESDALTYLADFLESWMDWDPGTRTLTGTPTPPAYGKTFHVKFRAVTPSGGADAFIAVIHVAPTIGAAARPAVEEAETLPAPQGLLAVRAPTGSGGNVMLSVFDIAGRRMARIHGRGGEVLVWDGAGPTGARVQTGIYLWRLDAGAHRREGKLAVLR